MFLKELNSNKLAFLVISITAAFCLLCLRLFDLQVLRGDYFFRLANDNRFFQLPIAAPRGVFLDRYGQALVHNYKQYYLLQDYQLLFSSRQPLSREEALLQMASDSAAVVYDVSRDYLYPRSLSHSLGYVAKVSKEDLLVDDYLSVSDYVGKMGLEQQFERILRGQRGSETIEINTMGEKQRLLQQQPAMAGQDTRTTLDPYLSEVALEALGKQKGVVLIADAKNNEILALISNPNFNLNDFSQVLLDEDQERLRRTKLNAYFQDEELVFFNRAVSGAYPPGSVFKLVTAIAGLETESLNEHTTVIDEGVLKVGEWEYSNWYYSQYGGVDGEIALQRAIARSNDIYFYKAAEWIGPDELANFARNFGFGQQTGVESGAETSGLVPDPAWKEKVIGEKWFLGNTYHFGIGQGDLMVSPVQILQMVQALANRGTLCRPTLLPEQAESCRGLGLRDEHVELVLKGMLDACSPGGTAFPFFEYNQEQRSRVWLSSGDGGDGGETGEGISDDSSGDAGSEAGGSDGQWVYASDDPYKEIHQGAIACKTGTAEFGGVEGPEGYRKTHAWFVAIVGTKDVQEAAAAVELEGLVVGKVGGEAGGDGGGTESDGSDGDNRNEGGEVSGNGVDESGLDDSDVADEASNEATAEAKIAQNDSFHRQQWLRLVKQHGFPQEIVMVVLVESDEDNPYKEGSADAGPVVKEVLEWIGGE